MRSARTLGAAVGASSVLLLSSLAAGAAPASSASATTASRQEVRSHDSTQTGGEEFVVAYEQAAQCRRNGKAVAVSRRIPEEITRFVIVAAVDFGGYDLQSEDQRLNHIDAPHRGRAHAFGPADLIPASANARSFLGRRKDANDNLLDAATVAKSEIALCDQHAESAPDAVRRNHVSV